jgi:hypothetical protein
MSKQGEDLMSLMRRRSDVEAGRRSDVIEEEKD